MQNHRRTFALLALSLFVFAQSSSLSDLLRQTSSLKPELAPGSTLAENVAKQQEFLQAIKSQKLAARDPNYHLYNPRPSTSPVTEVDPRLGSQAAVIPASGLGIVALTGGLDYLPEQNEDWISQFKSSVASWTQEHGTKDFSVFINSEHIGFFTNDLCAGKCPQMNHKRAFHIAQTIWNSKGQMSYFVWGGSNSSDAEVYSLGDRTWTTITATNQPEARYGAQSIQYFNYVVIWGGILADGSAPTSFLFFDASLNTWTEHESSSPSAPSPRFGFAAIPYAETVFDASGIIIGGVDAATGAYLNDMWVYSPIDDIWYNALEGENSTVSTITPPGFAFHTALIDDMQGILYVFLGDREDYRDVWTLSLVSGQWTPVEYANNVDAPALKAGYAVGSDFYYGSSVIFSGNNVVRRPADIYALNAQAWSVYLSVNTISPYWYRENCYPSYVWNQESRSCVSADVEEGCVSCYDYSTVQKEYVSELVNKTLNHDEHGLISSC